MGVFKDTIGAVSAKAGRLVDARNVLDPSGKTRRSFAGRVVGHFQRTGPNSWDAYGYVSEDGGPIDVFPAVKVQVEPSDARFRMRAKGMVLMVEWAPTEQERADMGEGADVRAVFLETCVEQFKHKAGIGVAAFIAKTLKS